MENRLFKIIIFFFVIANLFANQIIHEKVEFAVSYSNCKIEAYLDVEEKDIRYFYLLFKTIGNDEFIETQMIPLGHSKFFSEIPANFMIRDKIEYYLVLELFNDKVITFPYINAKENPIIIEIQGSFEKKIPINSNNIKDFEIVGINPDVVIISPEPGSRIRGRDCLISLAYLSDVDIDPFQTKIFLDDIDITNKVNIDSTYLSYYVKKINPGLHNVTIKLNNKYNQKFNDIIWSFTVLPKNINEYGFIKKQDGNFSAIYNHGNIVGSSMDFSDFIFNYNVEFDWLSCKTSYNKSSLESEYKQPFDRYVINLKNNFFDIKLGDSYPVLDNYALNGHHMRGLNLKFYKGPVIINMIKGNTKRAIQGNSNDNAIVASAQIEADSTIISLSRNNYTFQQELLGFKISTKIKNKFYFDLNYIKVEDNVSTVVKNISNADVQISLIDNQYNIVYDDLMLNYQSIFGDKTRIQFPSKNWQGIKPKDNFIYGSNIKFNFDASRIIFSTGFSISFLNENKWNSFDNISNFDTLGTDTALDGYFLDYYELNENFNQNSNFYNFSTHQSPFLPYALQADKRSFIDYYNMANLARYAKLKFRYLGHAFELGNIRNGPEYYSLLNPYLKTNFSESFFSDKINLFENKLLLYYKRSKIIEGLYEKQKLSLETYKTSFNVMLIPGKNQPTLNLGFSSFKSSNNENKIIDKITYNEDDVIEYVRKEELNNNQLNISISNEFIFLGRQLVNMNALLYNTKDIVLQLANLDTLLSMDYQPKDVSNKSYGISIKSIHSKYFESAMYMNSSYYSSGKIGFSNYLKQNLRHLQLNLIFIPDNKHTKYKLGTFYSSSWGSGKINKYRARLGFERKISNFIFEIDINYVNRFFNEESKIDSFMKIALNYIMD